MCIIPCSICGDYSECTIYYTNNRCRSCKYYKIGVLEDDCPCSKCKGFDFINKENEDFYESL